MDRPLLLVLALQLVLQISCSKHGIVDAAMTFAPRTGDAEAPAGTHWTLLTGDLHCHVQPPDDPDHVGRGLARTVELAESEGLDFVVLTPHVWGSGDVSRLDELARVQGDLRGQIAAVAAETDVLFIPGFEWTDYEYGHATLAFADVAALGPATRPDHTFIDRWVDAGGVVVINHPYSTPVESPISVSSWDLSWRAWTTHDRLPREIRAIDRRAQGVEVYNLAIDRMRDGFLLHTPHASMDAALFQMERQIRRQRRRIAPIGGSDSHSDHLRAATFVLAAERSERAIRDAIVAGRVCVKDSSACSLQARSGGANASWHELGAAVSARAFVDVRATGSGIEILRDGRVVASPSSGEIRRIDVPPRRCSLIRARVSGGESGPIYVNCPFADQN
jgi:hypothetical protein